MSVEKQFSVSAEKTCNTENKCNTEKKFDVICMGRIAVDLYGQQIGARLEDVASFAKYLGGSSGNVAYGSARYCGG
ncbi:putative carbohydrate kinase [Yersinia pseudotuberculosis]|nr:putative carbohydrate kinase [Yersinia pseudotuberculosis]